MVQHQVFLAQGIYFPNQQGVIEIIISSSPLAWHENPKMVQGWRFLA